MILSEKDKIIHDYACDALKKKKFKCVHKGECSMIKKYGDSLKKGDTFYRVSTKEKIENIDGILEALKNNDLESIVIIETLKPSFGVGG